MILEYDVGVAGGRIAGYTALTAAEKCRVAVVSKVHVTRSHSVATQWRIAASIGNEEEDHWEWHMYDTVKGSDYLADQEAVEILAKEAPNAVTTLEHMGTDPSRKPVPVAPTCHYMKGGIHTAYEEHKCILCGCCVSACPVILEQEQRFIDPAAILRAQKYIFIPEHQIQLSAFRRSHLGFGAAKATTCAQLCAQRKLK